VPKPTLRRWDAYCRICKERRSYTGLYEYVANDDNGVWIHTLLRCTRCEDPLFVVQEPEGFGDLSQPAQLFPSPRGTGLYGLPRAVRRTFAEAVRCLEDAGAPTAAALMCRTTLEVFCTDHGAPGKSLQKQLDWLRETGVIDDRLLGWAHELRALGNEAAHEAAPASEEDARDAIEFVEAFLSYVYTYQENFERFQQRRSAKKTRPSP
jgi:hypothetical protein